MRHIGRELGGEVDDPRIGREIVPLLFTRDDREAWRASLGKLEPGVEEERLMGTIPLHAPVVISSNTASKEPPEPASLKVTIH